MRTLHLDSRPGFACNGLKALVLGLLVAACQSGAKAPPAVPATPSPAEASPTQVVPAQCGTIKNLSRLGDIYLAGQPSAGDLELLKQQGVVTIIDYRRPEENRGYDEPTVAKAFGFNYLNLPWRNESELNDDIFQQAFQQLGNAPRPMVVHCGSANRVGAIWLAWRAVEGGLSLEEATAEAKLVGLRSPALEATAVDYVQRHRPDPAGAGGS